MLELIIYAWMAQAIIDAASYVPPPPSDETVKKISEL